MVAVFAASLTVSEPVAWAEPPQCLSANPGDWPPAARPYFLLLVSTASSMSVNVGGNIPASCTGGNNTSYGIDRRAHARCALKNVVEEYGAAVNFGLATFARTISGCSDDGNGLCNYGTCTHASFTGSADMNCAMGGCGPEPNPAAVNSSSRAGAFIRVAVASQPNNAPSNVPAVVAWLDGSCADSRELFASGCRPANGMLRDALRYYSNQWVPPAPVPGGPPLPSPLTSVANGERPCRTVHTILVTDGDETCDVAADAIDAAADLYLGFAKDGIQWSVKTHVINFAGNQVSADAIAAAGGTGSAFAVANEAQLTAALQAILDPAVVSETCDNFDNDCNGCTDEGFAHHCHQAQPCCAWNTPAQRATCLVNYQAMLPDADPKFLPCTTPAQQMDPTRWLCFDPGDVCADGVDNNCAAAVDEGCVGVGCADASACLSGFCVDEVCCDAACGDGVVDDCVACSVAAGAVADGACAPLTGPVCEDGDKCTLADACLDGVCTSDEPVMCPPPDDCHEAAVCAPDMGDCEFVAKADDSPCADDDLCTQGDVCAAGTCVAGPPVECGALDECHDAGVCDPQSGACSDPIKPDGAPCRGGSCSDGVCVGGSTSEPDSSSGVTEGSGGPGDTGETGETGVSGATGGASVTDSGNGASGTGTDGGQVPTEGGGGAGGTTSDSGGSGSGTDTSAQDGGGCGCQEDPSAPRGLFGVFVFGALWRRSRRGSRARRS